MPFDPNSYNKTPDDPERDIKRENGSKTLAAIEAANKAAVDRYKKAVEQYNEGLKENERLKAELARLEGGAPDSAPDPNPDQSGGAPDQNPDQNSNPDQNPDQNSNPDQNPDQNPDPNPDRSGGAPDQNPDQNSNPDQNPDQNPDPDQAPVGIREKFHKVLANPTVKKVLTGAAIVAITITASLIYSAIQKKNANLLGDTTSGQSLTGSRPAVSDTLNPTGSQDNKDFQDDPEELNPIEAIGILNKYDDYGKWCSKNKSSDVNFACAAEVAEVCKNDPTKMVKYTADGQVEALSDYMPFLPQQLLPEGFRDLSIIKMEHYLESLPDAAFDSAQYQIFNKIMDQAKTRPYFANGWHDNAFMRHENPDPDAPIVHEDMELVRCTTYENHKEYLEFYWEDDDGNEIGSMPVRMSPVRDEQGNIIGWEGCMQVITPSGTSIYEGLPEIPDPDTPDPGTTTTTDPETPYTPIIEWGKSGDPHGGEDVEISDQVDPESEVSEEQNNSTNTGNQGYVDDHGATPGSASDVNGTDSYGFADGILATDADTDDGRLLGGENQAANEDGSSTMAGENAYQNPEAIAEGEAIDEAGNNAQAEAQESGGSDNEGSTPGGDNYSDEDEEGIVAGGDF